MKSKTKKHATIRQPRKNLIKKNGLVSSVEFFPVGHGHFTAAEKILAIVSADSAPVKRAIRASEKKGLVLDATSGRRTRSVILLQGGFLVLSALNPDTMAHRYEATNPFKGTKKRR